MIEPLSSRLQMVFDMINRERSSIGRVIDVGSDHGLLALNCLYHGITEYCICTDIHEKPAIRTRKCLADNNLSKRSEVHCTDGLKGVFLKQNDVIVMAGMGGNTAVDIVDEAMKSNSIQIFKEIEFVIQPQKSSDHVRECLCSMGFKILDENVVLDRDFFYLSLRFAYDGVGQKLSREDKYYGPVLKNKRDFSIVRLYYEHLDEVYVVRSRGNEELKRLLEERV